jgi:outer membrane lipoprotein SlyB
MKAKWLLAGTAAAVLAGCASDPYYYGDARYSSPAYYPSRPAYSDVAYTESGRVVAIDVVRGPGRPSGGGAIAGAIVGGVLGHQVGSGRGNDAATVAGAVGGALAGNEIERRHAGGDDYYRVVVRFNDGREATFTQDSLNGLRVGDRVRVADSRLYRD